MIVRRAIGQALLAAVALATFGSFAYGGETKVGEAADATAAEAKKVGRKTKHETKKALKSTGAALDRAGNRIED